MKEFNLDEAISEHNSGQNNFKITTRDVYQWYGDGNLERMAGGSIHMAFLLALIVADYKKWKLIYNDPSLYRGGPE